MPDEGSSDEIVSGLVALIDAYVFLLGGCGENHDNTSLYYAIAQAYMSVSNRSCAERRGAAGNCVYMDDEADVERSDRVCADEIAFQLRLLDKIDAAN